MNKLWARDNLICPARKSVYISYNYPLSIPTFNWFQFATPQAIACCFSTLPTWLIVCLYLIFSCVFPTFITTIFPYFAFSKKSLTAHFTFFSINTPLPTGIKKKIYSAMAPISTAKSMMSQISSLFQSIINM